jgi:hypothetical protein
METGGEMDRQAARGQNNLVPSERLPSPLQAATAAAKQVARVSQAEQKNVDPDECESE